jgi:hypothetical protein
LPDALAGCSGGTLLFETAGLTAEFCASAANLKAEFGKSIQAAAANKRHAIPVMMRMDERRKCSS